jgi:hypothetical protein
LLGLFFDDKDGSGLFPKTSADGVISENIEIFINIDVGTSNPADKELFSEHSQQLRY